MCSFNRFIRRIIKKELLTVFFVICFIKIVKISEVAVRRKITVSKTVIFAVIVVVESDRRKLVKAYYALTLFEFFNSFSVISIIILFMFNTDCFVFFCNNISLYNRIEIVEVRTVFSIDYVLGFNDIAYNKSAVLLWYE